jgi:hypothetical protein
MPLVSTTLTTSHGLKSTTLKIMIVIRLYRRVRPRGLRVHKGISLAMT